MWRRECPGRALVRPTKRLDSWTLACPQKHRIIHLSLVLKTSVRDRGQHDSVYFLGLRTRWKTRFLFSYSRTWSSLEEAREVQRL